MPEPDRVSTGLFDEPLSTANELTVRRLLELFCQVWLVTNVTPCDPVAPKLKAPELAFMTMPPSPTTGRLLPVPVVKVVGTVALLPSPIWTPLSKVLPLVKVIVPAPVRLKRRDRTPGTWGAVTAEASILPNE